ncbi:MAG: SurA N-terminal domain-containing protein [Bacteroidales bacterium]|nr:SurA N-terminal domain-containing protein [Candidatus Colicola faecequi]
MATLGKIRKHGVLLIVIVGLAMLAFIVGDFLSSSTSYFNRKREYVGEIEGQKIHYTDYDAAKDQLTEVYKIETGRTDLDEDAYAQIRNQVWQMMLSDNTLKAQAKKIGMKVTAEELQDLCYGNNIHQIIRTRRVFFDENGQFNPSYLVQFLASLNQEAETPEQQANLQQAKSYWMYWENAVRITRLQEKYTSLLQHCVVANSLDAKYAFADAQTSADIEYVMQPYYAVSDSTVKVSTSDIKALYKKHLQMFKQQPNRDLVYVSFPVVPSEEDFQTAEAELKALQTEFFETEDLLTVVNTNSDITYDARDLNVEDVLPMYQEFAKNGKTGDVAELTFDEATNTYAMARLVKAGYALPDSVKLTAVAAEEGQENQELGWYAVKALTKDMAEKVFACKKGEQFTMAQGMGEQTFIVDDLSKATPKVKIAILARTVTASSKTYAQIFNSAKQFIVENPTEEKFAEAAQEAGKLLMPANNVTKNADKIAQLKQSRPIVRWAFEAKEGAVSDVFECGQEFIVAAVAAVREGEYAPMSDVQNELRFEAMNDKKAEVIMAQLKDVKSLEEAAKILGTEVQLAEGVSMAGFRFGAAAEPAVIGTAMKLNAGEVSAPIKGLTGVYVVKGGEKQTTDAEFDAQSQIAQLNMRSSYSLPYQALQLIEEKADVTDNRANFQ